ncbi:hypothetical protein HPP92_004967 [Vanilla planifolia]|uniref:Uncharacterized protein n=1 Tax=Vanilla planifolia TaxID=51239 RepID=A0A835VE60_VANPL|nr:hypothetical protein HPP92_004967 [Vanilla planifolia]
MFATPCPLRCAVLSISLHFIPRMDCGRPDTGRFMLDAFSIHPWSFGNEILYLCFHWASLCQNGLRKRAISVLLSYELLDDGFKGIEQAAILDVLALGYMLIGDCSMVEHLLQLLKEITSGVEDEQPLLDSILVHMGSMYSGLGKFDDASLAKSKSIPDNTTYGQGKIFRLIGRATKSRATYCQVIQILEKSKGFESEQLVIPLVSLGNLCIDEGKLILSSLPHRILSIYIKLHGEKDGRVESPCLHWHMPNVQKLVNLELSYKGKLRELRQCSWIAKDRSYKRMEESSSVVGCREHEGRDVLKECFLICENSKGIEHPTAVGHLINLATSYFRSKDFAEAERLLRTGLQIMSKDPKDQSVLMLHLAVTLYHLRQDEEAEKLALEVVQVREESFERNLYPLGSANSGRWQRCIVFGTKGEERCCISLDVEGFPLVEINGVGTHGEELPPEAVSSMQDRSVDTMYMFSNDRGREMSEQAFMLLSHQFTKNS